MDLLERYLQAVSFFLPRRQQDDIVRELSENLRSQMEDRAEELHRPLTEDEQADILRRHGHPMLVAGRYRAHQQLIGPVFFPLYVFALKAGLGVALLVTIIVTTITTITTTMAGAPVRQIVEAFLGFPGRALMVFAWTTLGFAALDFAQARLKLPRTWDPRSSRRSSGTRIEFPVRVPPASSSSPRPARPGCSSCRGHRSWFLVLRLRSSSPHRSGVWSTCRSCCWPSGRRAQRGHLHASLLDARAVAAARGYSLWSVCRGCRPAARA